VVKTIVTLILVLSIVGLSLLLYRSCTDNREYRERIEQLGAEIDKYSELNQRLSDQNTEFAESIERLKRELVIYRERIEEARRIAAELSADTTAISGELSKAIEQVRRIREKLQELKEKLVIE